MVDRLQEAELVERRADPADRRSWRLYLTENAQGLLAQFRPFADEMLDAALVGVSESDRAILRQALEQMRQNLSRRPVEPMVSHG